MIKRSLLIGLVAGSIFVIIPKVKDLPAIAQTATEGIEPTFAPDQSTDSRNIDTDAIEQAIYNQVNEYRKQQGLPALSLDDRISEKARIYSQNMASGAVQFGHDGFAQRVQEIAKAIPYSAAAENVAYNQGYTDPATQAFKGWLNSPGHRRNIEGNYNLTGIGVAKNDKGEYYFTQIFVRSRSE